MEFPGLGDHCSEATCRRLDFLPVKCDACEKIFCHSHMAYAKHGCLSILQKDVQVPVCPLCNSPVFTKRGEQPDIVVGAHIDNNCKSDTAKTRRKVFANKCSAKHCKAKEMMPVNCSECLLNYCLKHRHPADHQCEGKSAGLRRKAAEAAVARQNQSVASWKSLASVANSRTDRQALKNVQGNLSEDEALARALQASLQETSSLDHLASTDTNAGSQEAADHAFARMLAESEHQNSRQAQTAGGSREKCTVS